MITEEAESPGSVPASAAPHRHHFTVPRLREVARRSIPHLIEATIIPLGIYYLAMAQGGIFAAIVAAVAWDYACIAFRVVRGRRIPGILILASLGLTAKTILALASHSAFLYFLQPCLSTAGVGLLFAASILVGRPLAARLAHDFVPMPAGFSDRPEIRKVFVKITGVWAAVNVINGAAALALLLTQPIGIYNLEKAGEAHFVTALGIAVSAWWFMRTVRRHRHLEPALAPAQST